MRIRSLTQSVLEDDPRVGRQVDALRAAGHDVSVVAFLGPRGDRPAGATLLEPTSPTAAAKVTTALRVLGARTARRDPWSTFMALDGQQEFADAARAEPADLY